MRPLGNRQRLSRIDPFDGDPRVDHPDVPRWLVWALWLFKTAANLAFLLVIIVTVCKALSKG